MTNGLGVFPFSNLSLWKFWINSRISSASLLTRMLAPLAPAEFLAIQICPEGASRLAASKNCCRSSSMGKEENGRRKRKNVSGKGKGERETTNTQELQEREKNWKHAYNHANKQTKTYS